jgi:GDSL-like Lipase/Acylhydrolase family
MVGLVYGPLPTAHGATSGPDLTISVDDGGQPFTQPPRDDPKHVGGTWTATIRNVGSQATSAATKVHVACGGYFCLVGGTFIDPGGDGWVCEGNETSDLICTNDTLLAPGESLPPLKAPIAVASWRTSTVYATWVLSNDSDTNAADNTVDIATPVVDTIRTHLTLSVADSGKPFAPAPNEAPYTVGGEWTAVVRNTGTVASSGITTVRVGCSGYFCLVGGYFVGAGGTGWACDGDQSEHLVCTNETPVPAGGSLAPLVVPVAPWRDNNVYATLSLENPSDNNTDDNAVEISSPVTSREPAGGDMVVNLRANQPMFNAGGKGAYTITARNAGTAAMEGTITLYPAINYGTSQASGDGWTCDAATGECTRPGPVAPGEVLPPVTATTEQFPLTGTPSQVWESASVTADNDTNYGNSQGIYLKTTVTPDDADLTATLTDGGAPFTIGGDGHYTITVHNVGTGAANGEISVIYPTTIPQAESVSVNGQGWTCAEGVCTRPGPVAAGQVLPTVTATFHFPSSATVTRVAASTSISVDNDGQNANNQGMGLSTNLVPPAAQLSVTYVAMGDSYSAGEGLYSNPDPRITYYPAGGVGAANGPYDEGTDDPQAFNSCHRHRAAYGRLLAQDADLGRMLHVACSGAVTDDFFNKNNNTNQNEPPQLDKLAGDIGETTKVVTLTIGGNDAWFERGLDRCIEGPRPPDATHSWYWYNPAGCSRDKTFTQAVANRIAQLDGRKLRTSLQVVPPVHPIAEVLSNIHKRAPHATIYIAGYPRFFGSNFEPAAPLSRKMVCRVGKLNLPIGLGDFWVERRDAGWMNDQGNALNKVIRHQVDIAAQADSSLSVRYVSPGLFSGHGLCDDSKPWLNGLIMAEAPWSPLGVDSASFHPTAEGQKLGYEEAFKRRMAQAR